MRICLTFLIATLSLAGPAAADENAAMVCLFENTEDLSDEQADTQVRIMAGETVDGVVIASVTLGGEVLEETTLDGPGAVSVTVPQITLPRIGTPAPQTPTIALPSFNTPGAVMRQSDRFTVFSLGSDILFDFDKSDLRPAAQAAISDVAEAIQQNCAGLPISIHGHTDSKGSEAYNLTLSQARALSVQTVLSDIMDLEAAALTVVAHGEASPIAPNTQTDGSDNPEGRQQNRRVEIWIDRDG